MVYANAAFSTGENRIMWAYLTLGILLWFNGTDITTELIELWQHVKFSKYLMLWLAILEPAEVTLSTCPVSIISLQHLNRMRQSYKTFICGQAPLEWPISWCFHTRRIIMCKKKQSQVLKTNEDWVYANVPTAGGLDLFALSWSPAYHYKISGQLPLNGPHVCHLSLCI